MFKDKTYIFRIDIQIQTIFIHISYAFCCTNVFNCCMKKENIEKVMKLKGSLKNLTDANFRKNIIQNYFCIL